MLRQDNFIGFSIVCGFFIGIMFGIIKFSDPALIILWAILATAGIYLIVIACVSVYSRFVDLSKERDIPKEKLEDSLEYYRKEFDKKEKEVQNIRNFIKSIQSSD
ncbi:hypothetical protein [Helicobacter sp. 11S02629-2]|uniref:hypothetical protein n=1 Tax=Helicobacter sp. 11S02629-2 TaxID=1476195 RepID=UPI000BA5B2F3|nr:hypothetical protein [Helicobacter sp. 11S02629-2]PAF46014.1 hypothetical protein BKH40_00970 [Helicobacter sp. 11S02629-2]